ncbi:hypothetical protein NUW58_g2658 [Xylaria curta]|uniref:Uncharacterized protein n=1 Tax=Xylaria curta TaxID=42375 RepID=A0ACC1PG98_9PEZI|nr:hypothetical protein NUW58_g2658 [Xylaria curta]
MVTTPRQFSASRAVSETQQTFRNNDVSFAPSSSSAKADVNRQTDPRNQFTFRVSVDTPLPSVESPSTGERIRNISTRPPPPARVPSLSVTPSDSASDGIFTPTTVSTERNTISGLNAQIEGLRFSVDRPGMDMTSVSDALRVVATGGGRQSRSLLSPTPPPSTIRFSPERSSANRRRSGSRNSLEKHDVRVEAPSTDRFNLPAVQKALRDTRSLMSELADTLESSTMNHEPDSVMKRLHRQAKDLADFKCHSTRIVGFVGDSGTGKSSLLNSLLDFRDLARSSNGGGACTCVVTEFHFHEDEDFTITVERFSRDELIPELEKLLRDYRHFHLNGDLIDPHALVDSEKRARVANDTFQAMFPDIFVSSDTLTNVTEPEAISILRSWVYGFDQSTIREGHFGLDLQECSTLLMELTSDVSSRRASIWPWIKKIKVYLNSHVLSKGLILVDLPGLRDLNSARRDITERYLLKCDDIFVVAVEGRVTTDEGVRSVIELVKKARLSNVGIICTKSDDIKPTEALRDWKGTGAARDISRKLELIKHEESKLHDLEEEIAPLDEIGHDEMSDEELNEFNQLNSRLRSIRKLWNDRKFDLQRFLITTRNAAVKKELVKLYKTEVSETIFCASNKIYWDHRDIARDKAMPSLILSGILAIREYCMMMVSESQYTATRNYMRDDIGVLLGKLGLWVQLGRDSLSTEKKEKIRSTLDTLERKLYLGLCGHTSALNSVARSYKHEFDTAIFQPQGRHANRWSTAAREASDDWACWHHTSYAAFVRMYGTYCTGVVGARNWNEEIIQAMANDMSVPWDILQTTFGKRGEDISKSIDDLFDWAGQFIDTELNGSFDTASSLASTLSSQKRVLGTDIDDILNSLQSDLQTLRTDALSSIRTSFIGKSMEMAYTNARLESGRGGDARRKAIISSSVKQNGLFTDLLRAFKREFNEHVDSAQDSIQRAVSLHFDSIKNTLHIIRCDNVALECEKDPEFRRRVKAKLDVVKGEMERVNSTLAG